LTWIGRDGVRHRYTFASEGQAPGKTGHFPGTSCCHPLRDDENR
jgi:hypothetical protein